MLQWGLGFFAEETAPAKATARDIEHAGFNGASAVNGGRDPRNPDVLS